MARDARLPAGQGARVIFDKLPQLGDEYFLDAMEKYS